MGRKKREAQFKASSLEKLDYDPRFFNISAGGFGNVDYDWRTVADSYLKLGTAAALLFGLASYIPAPAEPILPIDLPTSISSKDSQTFVPDEKSTIYQVYQENAPERVDRIDKIADNAFFKRFDLLAPFRKKKRPSNRPVRPGKPPQILKPVQNTKKRQTETTASKGGVFSKVKVKI